MNEIELNKKIKELKAENKALKEKLKYATEFTTGVIKGHNVSPVFIAEYTKTYPDETEWINACYVREIAQILGDKR